MLSINYFAPADDAAQQILEAVRKDRRRLLIGADAKAVDVIQRILPQGYQKILQLPLPCKPVYSTNQQNKNSGQHTLHFKRC